MRSENGRIFCFYRFFFIFLHKPNKYNIMANIFLKKTMASMLDMPMAQVESILSAADAFKNNDIDRDLAIKVFNKFADKKPSEINKVLKLIDEQF